MFSRKITVYSHKLWWTHLDELLASYLIEKYLQNIFEEFKMEDVIEIKDNEIKPWYFIIGVGKGELDDKDQYGRRKNTCVARLVAEKYDLIKSHPEIEQIVKDVEWIDLNGSNGKLCMSKIIKNIAESYGKIETIRMARKIFKSRIEANYRLFHDPKTIKIYENARKINHPKGQIVVFVQFSKNDVPYQLAFNKGASVAVIYNPISKNVQVLGNKKLRVNLESVYDILKAKEKDLCGETWYFHPPCLLLNGSKTHNTRPTTIPLKEILRIIKDNINSPIR